MGDKKRSKKAPKRKFSGFNRYNTKSKQSQNQNGGEEVAASPSTAFKKLDIQTPKVDLPSAHKEGFIHMSVALLTDFIERRTVCSQCRSAVECVLDLSKRHGFANSLKVMCTHCDFVEFLQSSETVDSNKRGMKTQEVNIRMVSFIHAIGKGHSALKTYSLHLNSPPPMTYKNYSSVFDQLHSASIQVATDSMKKAAEEVTGVLGSEEDGVTNCAASFDGTWQRRGHSSHHGVVSAISVDTGKCLDVETLSNTCKGCEIWNKKNPSSPEYQRWQLDHKCSNNHDGKSASMESVGAVRIFSRSENTRDLRYTKYLGDGDTAAFKKVRDFKPYGDSKIIKLEFVGHIQKRLGSRLRQLKVRYRGTKLSDGKSLTGARRLTEKRMNTLQNYFGFAIRESDNVADMQKAIWAGLYHVASSDDHPQHQFCPDNSWCGYVSQSKKFVHKHGLPSVIVNILKPIYESLTESSLLTKCLHGKTQNNNENLNKLIWDRCSKENFVGHKTVEQSVCSTVSHFNDGNRSVLDTFAVLTISPGTFSNYAAGISDTLRIRWADKKTTEHCKQRQKILRARRKGYLDNNASEDDEYAAGQH